MRVATFNIRHGEAAWGRVDVGLLTRTCAELGVDVLGLQEVDRWMRRSRLVHLSARVARRTGMAHAFGPALRAGWVGGYGNSVLVRGSLSDVDNLPLPYLGGEPRAALLATAHVGTVAVSVANTHLSFEREERDRQLAAVVDALAARPLPRLLLGDLNGPPEDVAPLVESAGLHLLVAGPTFPASGPARQIDHIATTALSVLRWSVPETPVSDHRPLVAELAYTSGSAG